MLSTLLPLFLFLLCLPRLSTNVIHPSLHHLLQIPQDPLNDISHP
jgi:hypothetical protein